MDHIVLTASSRIALGLAFGATLVAPALVAGESVQTDIGTTRQEDVAPLMKKPGYSPYAGRSFPTRVYWGDTHLHTAISLDAGAVGCTLGPEAAYRFARGEEVTSSTGQRAQLSRPLDFLVVSDHAEAFGSMVEVVRGNPTLMANPTIILDHRTDRPVRELRLREPFERRACRIIALGERGASIAGSEERSTVQDGPQGTSAERRSRLASLRASV